MKVEEGRREGEFVWSTLHLDCLKYSYQESPQLHSHHKVYLELFLVYFVPAL